MELVIVRHGESEGNAEGRMQGRKDYGLTEAGRRQARVLSEWLAQRRIGWDAAYTSPLSRALNTAQIVAEHLGQPAPSIDPDLCELSAGRLEGLTRPEMERQFPEFFDRGITEIGDFSAFDGEDYETVQLRARAVIDRLVARHRDGGQRVLLIGHGGFNFQLVKMLICESVPRVCILSMGNCCATLVRMRHRRGIYMGELVWHVPLELMGAASRDGVGAVFR